MLITCNKAAKDAHFVCWTQHQVLRRLARRYISRKVVHRIYLISLALILQSCASHQPTISREVQFEVLDFSQGKMREESSGWIVYEPGQEMQFAINGQCVFNRQVIPCMWHGFILKYDSHGADVGLHCKSVTTSPTNIGNPEKIDKVHSTTYEYTIPLEGSKKIFVNPQYTGGGPPGTTNATVTKCSVSGKEVLEFYQIFHFPVNRVEI